MNQKFKEITSLLKALGDSSRLTILSTLTEKPHYAEELTQKLGLAASTVSFHLKKLEEAGLIIKNKTQYYSEFRLNDEVFQQKLIDLISANNPGKQLQDKRIKAYRVQVIKAFVERNKVQKLPVQQKKRIIILEWILDKIDQSKDYTETEISEEIKKYHEDYCTVRRELVDYGYMDRKNNCYYIKKYEKNEDMDMMDKKTAKYEYKNTKLPTGIFIIKCKETNSGFINSSTTLETIFKRFLFELDMGTYPYRRMMDDYKMFGKEGFEFIVLEKIKTDGLTDEEIKQELKSLKEMYIEKLKQDGVSFYNV